MCINYISWYNNDIHDGHSNYLQYNCQCLSLPDLVISFSSSSSPSILNSLHLFHWHHHRVIHQVHLFPSAVPEMFLQLACMRGSSKCTHSFQRSEKCKKKTQTTNKRKTEVEILPFSFCIQRRCNIIDLSRYIFPVQYLSAHLWVLPW